MAIINKDRYLKDIAAAVRRGVMDFELQDRPVLEMGGYKVFVSSVSYDMDHGELTFSVSNSKGETLASSHGVRPLSKLDAKSLSEVASVVRRYESLRRKRSENLMQIASRSTFLSRKQNNGLSL